MYLNRKSCFKNTFNKNIDSYKSDESPVSQNLFYVDLQDKTVEKIDFFNKLDTIKIDNYMNNRNEFIIKLVGARTTLFIYQGKIVLLNIRLVF